MIQIESKNILQIVIKNTSTMDFTAPVIRGILGKQFNYNLTVLYCALDKKSILRNSRFWESFFESHAVEQLDFCDFIKGPFSILEKPIRLIFSFPRADRISIRENWNFYKLNHSSISKIGFVAFLSRELSFVVLLRNFLNILIAQLEKIVTILIVQDGKVILNNIDPNLILFDNRSVTNFPGRQGFYDWMYEHEVPVALLPHAPHLRDPVSEFCPFDEWGNELPDFCHFWVPFRFGEPWERVPGKRTQFVITGYPGLDTSWLSWCMKSHAKKREGGAVRCLFILRRYLPRGAVRPEGVDPYILNYEDFFGPLSALARAFKEISIDFKLVLKPHPANNYTTLALDMKRAGINEWEISDDPVYPLLSQVDLVVSVFSTILLVPAMAGVPTVLLKTALQDTVHQQWPILEELYTNLRYYVENIEDLPNVLREILYYKEWHSVSSDQRNIRRYFPDGGCKNVISDMRKMLGAQE